jgi:flagellar export protein FliJ
VKTFRFPLERVLDWRHLQMRAEEEKLAAMQHRLNLINQGINTLVSAESKSEWGVLKMPSFTGSDLQALAAFQDRVRKQRIALEIERAQFEKQIAAQRARLLKARKDFRILEKLKEKRKKAWTYLSDREVESAAAEAHISRLVQSGDGR